MSEETPMEAEVRVVRTRTRGTGSPYALKRSPWSFQQERSLLDIFDVNSIRPPADF